MERAGFQVGRALDVEVALRLVQARTPCQQLKCGGRVAPAVGLHSGHGRCRRCGVVLRWGPKGWRVLTDKEWQRAPYPLASLSFTGMVVWVAPA